MRKPSTKNMRRGRTKVKQEFGQTEWKEKSDQLTRKMKEVELKDESIKANAATAKAELKGLKAEVNELANQLRNGYTMQEVDAFIDYVPKKAIKRYHLIAPGTPEDGKVVKEEPMTEEDFQLKLEIDEAAEDAKAKPAEPGPGETAQLAQN